MQSIARYINRTPKYVLTTSKIIGSVGCFASSWFYAQDRDSWEKYPYQKAVAFTVGTGISFGLGTFMLLRHPVIAFGISSVTIACLAPKGPIIEIRESNGPNSGTVTFLVCQKKFYENEERRG